MHTTFAKETNVVTVISIYKLILCGMFLCFCKQVEMDIDFLILFVLLITLIF